MEFVFEPPPSASVAVRDRQARFPVRRIYCVGSNYAAHAREMGRDPQREPPFFFSKPADAVIDDGAEIPYPAATKNFHFEGELVVAIGLAGHRIRQDQALDHVWGYAAGNDLTRRDLQQLAKDTARPWDMAKGFDQSAANWPDRTCFGNWTCHRWRDPHTGQRDPATAERSGPTDLARTGHYRVLVEPGVTGAGRSDHDGNARWRWAAGAGGCCQRCN